MTALADFPVAQAGPRACRGPGSRGPGPAAVPAAGRSGAVRGQAKIMRSWPLLVLAVPAASPDQGGVQASLIALRLATAGKPVSQRALRNGGVQREPERTRPPAQCRIRQRAGHGSVRSRAGQPRNRCPACAGVAARRSVLHVVGVAGGDLSLWRDVPEDGAEPVSGAEGERTANMTIIATITSTKSANRRCGSCKGLTDFMQGETVYEQARAIS